MTIHNPAGLNAFLGGILDVVGDDRSQPVAIICARGGRSTRAQRFLTENGFTDVANIREGMVGSDVGPGWLARPLPTEPCAAC